jgi:hypothetical protein
MMYPPPDVFNTRMPIASYSSGVYVEGVVALLAVGSVGFVGSDELGVAPWGGDFGSIAFCGLLNRDTVDPGKYASLALV